MRNVPIKEIAAALGLSSEREERITGYEIDSRKLEPENLFFALKGNRTDGHEYLEEAKKKGALAAVVLSEYTGPDWGLILLRVDDVTASLQMLAKHFMKTCPSTLIGITGSLGKTTVKEFVSTLLEAKFKVGKTQGNYNTKLTYPITLLNRAGDEGVLVVEMGMSEWGDMERLVEIAAPDVAVVTKVAWVHGAYFPGGIEEIAKGKAQIFQNPKTKKAIFDHSLYRYADFGNIQGEKISFSLEEKEADYFLSKEFFIDEKGVRAYQFDPPFKQEHILHNFLAAVSVARAMKMSWDEINAQVPKLKLPKMRFELFEKEGITFINDAYNANPDSMRAALASLPEPKEGGKRIAVLGMMAEMGSESEKIHYELGQFAQRFVDHLLVLGKEASGIYEGFCEVKKPAEKCADFERLQKRLKQLMRPGDVVLVKASRCVQMENLFSLLEN